MSIRIGFYDFFAYAVPGALYVLLSYIIITYFNIVSIESLVGEASIVHFGLIIIFSYIFGFLFDYISDATWYSFFGKKRADKKIQNKFTERNENYNININADDWAIYLALIKKEDMEVAENIEKFNVIHKMLRNISFNFLISSLLTLFLVINHFSVSTLIISLLFLVFSVLLLKRSIKFDYWFHTMIYETVCVRVANILDTVKS